MENKYDELEKSAIEYINRLKSGMIEAAELFQRCEEKKATAILCEITEGVQWIIEALVKTNKLTEVKNLQINDKLKEIVSALENEDYILVGDLLQYELLPEIVEIEETLKHIKSI